MNEKNHNKNTNGKIISLKDKMSLEGEERKNNPTPNLGKPITHLRQWASKNKKNPELMEKRTSFWHIVQLIALLGLTAVLMKTCSG